MMRQVSQCEERLINGIWYRAGDWYDDGIPEPVEVPVVAETETITPKKGGK